MLEIRTTIDKRIGNFYLLGELDIASVELFKSRIETNYNNVDSVVMDLEKLEFLDSTGVAALIEVFRKLSNKNIDIKVKNISEEAFEVLDILGVPELFGDEMFLRKK